MTTEVSIIDVSAIPELARLAREVATDGQPRLLRAGDNDLAILSPAHPVEHQIQRIDTAPSEEPDDVLAELARRRKRGLSVTDMTAGIFKAYAKTPPPTPREEKDAFERAVAEQVIESLRD